LPIPTLFLLAFASGAAAAIASRRELRVSPRPALLSRGFGALALFLALVLVPVSVYFYVFHGDWSLLYLVDVRSIPSAVALVGFVVEGLLGAAGFVAGAALVRAQRDALAGVLAGTVAALAGGLVLLVRDRLSVVGSLAQYRGGFGLEPFSDGPVATGGLTMGAILVIGLAYLFVRLALGGRRAG
jgi:hypothetical protein